MNTASAIISPTNKDILIAAILSDLVYQSAGETVKIPPGLLVESLDVFLKNYNQTDDGNIPKVKGEVRDQDGYVGMAFVRLDQNGNPTAIFQVSRGTVFSAPDQSSPLNDGSGWDTLNTLLSDIDIVALNSTSNYVDAAQAYGQQLADITNFFKIPLIETGQSLGGFTALNVTNELNKTGIRVQAITFNALPFTSSMAGDNQMPSNIAENYYVGNELLTRNIVVGEAIGTNILLSELPVDGPAAANALLLHDANSAVAQVITTYFTDSPSIEEGINILKKCYPNSERRPAQISDLINGLALF